MDAIVHDSHVSYYQQLYTILRREIARGTWKPGDRMPSEAELIAAYGVSRITVRQAFDLLVNDGLVYRRRGSGTFIAAAAGDQGANRIVGFDEEMRLRGLHPSSRVLATRLEPAAPGIATVLGVVPGTELAVVERLRLADGAPVALENCRLVHSQCPGVLEGDYSQVSLHETLRERYGIRLGRAIQSARAVAAEEPLAGWLDVPVGAPLLSVTRISFSRGGLALEHRQTHYRGDRYTLESVLRG